jgi:hypothetical protein
MKKSILFGSLRHIFQVYVPETKLIKIGNVTAHYSKDNYKFTTTSMYIFATEILHLNCHQTSFEELT